MKKRIIGSNDTPSLYKTNRYEVKISSVPASGCKAIKIQGKKRANKSWKRDVIPVIFMFTVDRIFARSKAVAILANSAG